jgi:hypothetical protein
MKKLPGAIQRETHDILLARHGVFGAVGILEGGNSITFDGRISAGLSIGAVGFADGIDEAAVRVPMAPRNALTSFMRAFATDSERLKLTAIKAARGAAIYIGGDRHSITLDTRQVECKA